MRTTVLKARSVPTIFIATYQILKVTKRGRQPRACGRRAANGAADSAVWTWRGCFWRRARGRGRGLQPGRFPQGLTGHPPGRPVLRGQVRVRCARLTSGTRRSDAQHLRQMAAVAHLDAEEHREHVAAVRALHRHGVDVGVGVGDGEREIGQQAAAVGDEQADARSRTRPARRSPIRRRPARPHRAAAS